MSKRLGLNLILLLLVVVLAVVVYLDSIQKELASQSASIPLSSLPQNEVNKIQLQRDGAQTIRIERLGSRWMMVTPVRVAASDYRLEQLLKLLSASSHARFPVSARPLSSFGLAKPSSSVRFNDQTIFFGGTEPLNQRRYVMLGDQVHLIDDRYFYQSQLLFTALVEMTLLPTEAELVQVRLPGGVLQQRQGDWQWQPLAAADVVSPAPSMDRISHLLTTWRNVRAQRVSPYQVDVAEGAIALKFSAGDDMVLEILARDPELILGRKALGLRYHFSADQGRDMLMLLPPSVGPGGGQGLVVSPLHGDGSLD